MSDRIAISREQWPPSSPTAGSRRPQIRLPGAPGHLPAQSQPIQERSLPGVQLMSTLDSPRQHARLPSEVFFTNRATERSPSWSASKGMDTRLHSKPRAYRKRVRAEDLWDRDEEELLQQRRAKELASSVSLAGVGEKEYRPESVSPSEPPQDLHGFYNASDDILHSGMIGDRERAYTRPPADALNIAEDDILACSPESQSNERAYPWPQFGALNYAEDEIPSRSAESGSRPDLKRPRDRYLDDFETEEDAGLEKRRRNGAGYTEPSTMGNDLLHKTSQDVQLKRLKKRHDAANKASKFPKRQKGKKNAGRSYQTLSADPPPVEIEHDGMNCLATTFPKFGSLPDNVQDIIFNMLLESPDPIKLDTASLKAFARHSVAIPNPKSSTKIKKRIEHTMKPATELDLELDNMKAGLNNISPSEWPSESVASGLTLSILLVSKSVHMRAAKSFYGNNVFEFSNAHDAWLHLEVFLSTIGPRNASNLQHLSVAMPHWLPNTASDRIAATLLDALSPIMRLAACTNVVEDPLISAISTCTSLLIAHGGLESIKINMSLGNVHTFLDYRHQDLLYNLSKAEKANRAKRRDEGVRLLCALNGALTPGRKTELVIHNPRDRKKNITKFDSYLPAIQLEVEQYGWDVDRVLKVRDKVKFGGKPETSDRLEAQEDE